MIDPKPEVVAQPRNEHSGVSLHIERVTIDGARMGPGQAAQLQAALEQELARLIATNGLDRKMIADGAIPSIRTKGIELDKAVNPRRFGSQIAQAVYSGLKV